MQTWHILIKGQVQGVGFRPLIFLLAQQFNINGWVNNGMHGVHIEFNSTSKKAKDFLIALLEHAPVLAHITTYEIIEISPKSFSEFVIKHSQNKGESNLLITPDAAICLDCTKELFARNNRRNTYPFITCTNCGPRYSIIQEMPYDRQQTTMKAFQMCSRCQEEYSDPNNRRFYSQTNSCSTCAIELELFECKDKVEDTPKVFPILSTSTLVEKIVQSWQEGKIVAIKGIGGYILTVDASNETAVQLLRRRKHRPTKPFAIMFPHLEAISKELIMKDKERELLTSTAAPIVLLQKKEISENFKDSKVLASSIAPNLNQLGAMLPYSPFYKLLLKKFGQAIIATSGNRSNSPIIFKEEKALKELSTIADFLVTHNRKIVVPQDDSLVKITPFHQQKIILRRSRGYAPTYITPSLNLSSKTIMAMGGQLKSTFALAHQDNTFVSQYLGDLDNYETQENYKHTLHHFLNLIHAQPSIILIDKHIQYASSIYGKEVATQLKIPIKTIQHHEAHFAAVIAEHNLIENKTPILGVIWDGTGLGDDGHIWGGEFFIYQNYQFKRSHHLKYVNFIVGDKMAKEPRISALSFCWDLPDAIPYLEAKFTKMEWSIYNKLLKKGSSLKTSSIGRLFDAVASLLGIMNQQSYEGEAAMLLETVALNYYQKNGLNAFSSSNKENKSNFNFTTKDIFNLLLEDLIQGKSIEFVAAHFHFLLMKHIKKEARTQNVSQIAFSGGVFQNGLLVDLLIHHLGTDFDLYFHKDLSPNDENISFGQLVHYHISSLFARRVR